MRSLVLLLCVISVVNCLEDESYYPYGYGAENTYPFLARIMYNDDLICGGTIISNQYILTCAECVYKREPKDLIVFAGIESEYEEAVEYLVELYHLHSMSRVGRTSAICLLRVVGNIEFNSAVQPITLSSSINFPAGKMATLIGWDAELYTAGEMKEKILPQESCTDLYRICTYRNKRVRPQAPCYDLIGNPLTLNSKQIGINSGYMTCSSSRNSYTMVGLHTDWINEKIGQVTGVDSSPAKNQKHSYTYYITRVILILLLILLIYLFRSNRHNLRDIFWFCLSYLFDMAEQT